MLVYNLFCILYKFTLNRLQDNYFKVWHGSCIILRCKAQEKRSLESMLNEIMAIITHAGDAKSDAFEALENAREGDFDIAKKLLDKSRTTMIEAHKAQTQLLQKEAQGDDMKISILLIHAQDHLMTAKLAQELIEQLIEQTKEIQELKKINGL